MADIPGLLAAIWSVLSSSVTLSLVAVVIAALSFFFGPYQTRRAKLRGDANRLNAILLHLYQILLRYDRAILWARGDGVAVEEYEACHSRIQPRLADELLAQSQQLSDCLELISKEQPVDYVLLHQRFAQLRAAMFGNTPSTERYPEIIYADLVRSQDVLVADVIDELAERLRRRIARPCRLRWLYDREERRILDYLSRREEQDRDFVEGMGEQRRTRTVAWRVQDVLKELATVRTEADFRRVLPVLTADWESAKRYGTSLRDFVGGYVRMLQGEFGVDVEDSERAGRFLYQALDDEPSRRNESPR